MLHPLMILRLGNRSTNGMCVSCAFADTYSNVAVIQPTYDPDFPQFCERCHELIGRYPCDCRTDGSPWYERKPLPTLDNDGVFVRYLLLLLYQN